MWILGCLRANRLRNNYQLTYLAVFDIFWSLRYERKIEKGVFALPQRRNAIKALRINERRFQRNHKIKNDIRKTVKKFKGLLAEKNQDEARKVLSALYQQFDKAVKSDLFHKNTAARRKSHFSRLLAPPTKTKKS